MNEQEIRRDVDAYLRLHGLDAEVFEVHDLDDAFALPSVDVLVARGDYARALSLESYFDDYLIRWRQRAPSLVSADLGDLVLVHDAFKMESEPGTLAVVTSKYWHNDVGVSYGCRRVLPSLGDSFVSQTYAFELADEDYGGRVHGFLRVLTPAEAVAHLRHQLHHRLDAAIRTARDKFASSERCLDELVAALARGDTAQCARFELNEDELPVGVKAN